MRHEPDRGDDRDPEEEGSAAREPQQPKRDPDQDPEEEGSSGRPQR